MSIKINKTSRKVGFRKAAIPAGGKVKGIGKAIKPIKVPKTPNYKVPKKLKV